MGNIGPVEYMVVAFPGNQFRGEIGPALQELVDSGTIRILDLAFVTKGPEGNIFAVEIEDLEDETGAQFRQFQSELNDLVNLEDLLAVAEELEPNSSAAVLVWEDLWASKLATAMRNANGRLLDLERLPREVVQDALAHAGVA